MNRTEAEYIVKILDAALRPFADTSYPFEITADHSGVASIHFVSGSNHYAGGIPMRVAREIIENNTSPTAIGQLLRERLTANAILEGRASGTRPAGGTDEAAAQRRASFASDLKMLEAVKKIALTLSEKVHAYAKDHGPCTHNAHEPAAKLSSFHHVLDDQIAFLKDAIKECDAK